MSDYFSKASKETKSDLYSTEKGTLTNTFSQDLEIVDSNFIY
jgi:hypothetical protein